MGLCLEGVGDKPNLRQPVLELQEIMFRGPTMHPMVPGFW